jgi:hypothetical protein
MARKLVAYHFSCLLSFETHGIASVARLQREKMSRSAKEAREIGTFSTGFYKELASSPEFPTFVIPCKSHGKCSQSTGSTASFEIHCKSNQI